MNEAIFSTKIHYDLMQQIVSMDQIQNKKKIQYSKVQWPRYYQCIAFTLILKKKWENKGDKINSSDKE